MARRLRADRPSSSTAAWYWTVQFVLSTEPSSSRRPDMEASTADTRVLMTGIGLGESPRWHEGRLWFADWVAHELIALDADGSSEVITNVRSLPFSIDWLPGGPMLITSGRKLLRFEPDRSMTTHADLSALSQ